MSRFNQRENRLIRQVRWCRVPARRFFASLINRAEYKITSVRLDLDQVESEFSISNVIIRLEKIKNRKFSTDSVFKLFMVILI